jgi:hypothetical protein
LEYNAAVIKLLISLKILYDAVRKEVLSNILTEFCVTEKIFRLTEMCLNENLLIYSLLGMIHIKELRNVVFFNFAL